MKISKDMIQPVYIAGCYRSPNRMQKIKNILHANDIAQQFAEQGILFFSPISHTAKFDEACPGVPQVYWLRLGSYWLEQCKSVYFMQGWQESAGATAELKRAKELGLEVYFEEARPGIEFEKQEA